MSVRPDPLLTPVMSPFWMLAWAGMVALGWLLPNHYFPWTAFHLDTVMATAFALAGAAVFVRSGSGWEWRGIHALAAAVMLVPLIQRAVGQIHFDGVAWMHSLYLLGLLLAIHLGTQWQARSPDQPVNALFLAIGIAAFVSVGFQLHQWLRLDVLEVWVMPDNFNRPFANLGQPNQLATLFLWALLGLVWAHLKGAIRTPFAVAGAMFLLFGLSLTASRTSWVGVGWILLAVWVWRRLWPQRAFAWGVTLLVVWLVIDLLSVNALREVLLGGHAADAEHISRATVAGESRPAIWWMLLDALLRQPWAGYGWGQIQWANLAVAADHTPKHIFFAHAHNIALELCLVMGIPIALAVLGAVALWLWRRIGEVRDPSQVVLIMLLLVTLNHAMLELPLHYAYFLLPVGLIVGVLDARTGHKAWVVLPRWTFAVGWLLAVSLLALTVRDYSRIEPEYAKLRFEWARIKTDPAQAPDVLLLDQFPAFVRAVRREPWAGMPASDMEDLELIATQFPSPPMLAKLARAQALNDQTGAAARTLTILCKTMSPELCAGIRLSWLEDGEAHPAIKAVPWPLD